jgi:hypothetical protein
LKQSPPALLVWPQVDAENEPMSGCSAWAARWTAVERAARRVDATLRPAPGVSERFSMTRSARAPMQAAKASAPSPARVRDRIILESGCDVSGFRLSGYQVVDENLLGET